MLRSRCTSTRRVLVHQKRYDELVSKLVHAYGQVQSGDPLDSDTLMGPLVNKSAVDLFMNAMKEIEKSGGTVLYGGKKKEELKKDNENLKNKLDEIAELKKENENKLKN